MKEIISITELAKLRNVSAETLRHYDRIGLFAPTYTNPQTGYRYYSILYYSEHLGTIKELQQLGMTLKEIKEFLANRNIEKSLNTLRQKKVELRHKIQELQDVYSSLSQKVDTLETFIRDVDLNNPFIKRIPKRKIATTDKFCHDDSSLSYETLKLERIFQGKSIVASNRYGVLRNHGCGKQAGLSPFILLNEPIEMEEGVTGLLPEGEYICLYYEGELWDIQSEIEIISAYAQKNNIELCETMIQIIHVDITVTGSSSQMILELQTAIKK